MKQFPGGSRESTNPIFNANRLKLGVFGVNGPGVVMTDHPDRFVPTWQASLEVCQAVDRAGFEAVVPYSRWKAFGDARHITGTTLDTFAWAAGVSALTSRCGVFSTCHTPTLHPLMAAKQGATIDHISGGRFTLNVVVGWYTPEMETFGIEVGDHDARYDQADEWLTALKRLWLELDEVDIDGRYVKMRGGVSSPKPFQKPMPPIMNAGSSERGRQFAARHADVAYIIVHNDDPAAITAQVAAYKKFAMDEYQRKIQVWAYALVLQKPTVDEAESRLREYVVDHPDLKSIDIFVKYQVKNAGSMPPEAVAKLRLAVASGGGIKLVGPPEHVANRLEMLTNCGLDGVLLTFVDYVGGTNEFVRDVVPLLEARGLRLPNA